MLRFVVMLLQIQALIIMSDKSLYQSGTELILSNVTADFSGNYQCRANSPAGAILSPAATLTVKENMNDFCIDALKPKVIVLPIGCFEGNASTYDVGECIPKRCRSIDANDTASCREEPSSCCSAKDSYLKTLHCVDYNIQLVIVKSCGCSVCESNALIIKGRALSAKDNSPVKYGAVSVNGIFEIFTSASGEFIFTYFMKSTKVTIKIEDNFGKEFLPGLKTIELSEELGGTINVEIKMFAPPEPVEISSTEESILSLGSTGNGSSKIQMTIPPNEFYYKNGTAFNGNVMTYLTFLDPTNASTLDSIPGDFRIVDEEGEVGDLESLGVFNMFFKDASGQPLVMNDVVDMFIPLSLGSEEVYQDFKLWRLSTESGYWENVQSNTEKRRKRRSLNSALWIGEIDWSTVSKQEWFNYDKVYRLTNSPCFFKLKLYMDENMRSKQQHQSLIYIQTHYNNGNTLRTIKNYLSSRYNPDDYCARVICENESAFTTLQYYKSGYGYKPLYAMAPYIDSGSTLLYSIGDSETTLKIEMKRTVDGPFYEDENTCRASDSDGYYLRYHFGNVEYFRALEYFTKPILTGYESRSDLDNFARQSSLAWYPEHGSYTVCFIKIRLDFSSTTVLSQSHTMKMTVASSRGTNTDLEDTLFGTEQVNILNSLSSYSYCIEYKCSGIIPQFLGSKHYDHTYVTIKLYYPVSYIECRVTQESTDLSTSNEPDSPATGPGYSNRPQINSDDGIYQFFDPSNFGPNYGTYKSTSDNLDVSSASTIAQNECRSGRIHDHLSEDDTLGVAVTFTCHRR